MKKNGRKQKHVSTNYLIHIKAMVQVAVDFFANDNRNISIKIKNKFMQTQDNVKDLVRQKYSEIALQDKETNQSSCCGSGCCSTEVYNVMSDDYSQLGGYNSNADLGLGCGLPTNFAKIKKGDVVIDLGSGA